MGKTHKEETMLKIGSKSPIPTSGQQTISFLVYPGATKRVLKGKKQEQLYQNYLSDGTEEIQYLQYKIQSATMNSLFTPTFNKYLLSSYYVPGLCKAVGTWQKAKQTQPLTEPTAQGLSFIFLWQHPARC